MITGEVINGTPNMFTNSQYHFWFKELMYQLQDV